MSPAPLSTTEIPPILSKSYLKPCVPHASMHLSLPCNLHILRILHVTGQRGKPSVIIILRNQKSEPNKVITIRFAAAAVRNWLFIGLFANLMRDDGKQVCNNNAVAAVAANDFLRNVLRNYLRIVLLSLLTLLLL